MRGARIKDFTSTNHSLRDNRKSRLLQRKIIKHSLYVHTLWHIMIEISVIVYVSSVSWLFSKITNWNVFKLKCVLLNCLCKCSLTHFERNIRYLMFRDIRYNFGVKCISTILENWGKMPVVTLSVTGFRRSSAWCLHRWPGPQQIILYENSCLYKTTNTTLKFTRGLK